MIRIDLPTKARKERGDEETTHICSMVAPLSSKVEYIYIYINIYIYIIYIYIALAILATITYLLHAWWLGPPYYLPTQ